MEAVDMEKIAAKKANIEILVESVKAQQAGASTSIFLLVLGDLSHFTSQRPQSTRPSRWMDLL
jgi:hypothetical protein